MSTQITVQEASWRFYAALNRMLEGDLGAMAAVWSSRAPVTTMHPIGGREQGRDDVLRSFAQFAELARGGQVTLNDQLIQEAGDTAFETGTEEGRVTLGGEQVAIHHRVTNIYKREGGAWAMIHHHSDLSPRMVDVIAGLQGRA